ncbi:hypothetical protein ACFQ0G_53535 [Streptomyces chiangmaiensis]|uniref:hypothetical protein n=1 Tax=Streptomyces chiangmaiensis TaxID=766497 RepID=UPI0031E8A38D
MTQTSQQTTPIPATPNPVPAVLYVCVERSLMTPGLAAERAEEEGQSFAQARGLTITEVIRDPYGEPDPCLRKGWRRVRALAESGSVSVVIVRWPSAIAPDSSCELRHREICWLQDEHGVSVRYSWEPLAGVGGDAK